MKIIFEINGRKHLMSPEQAEEVLHLIATYGNEVYEHRTNWSTKVESHHVYAVTPSEMGAGELKYISDALYGMGKLRGKPE
jgi:hypothetical protein